MKNIWLNSSSIKTLPYDGIRSDNRNQPVTWSDIPFQPARKALRQFAGAWLVFFLAFGLHQYLVRGHHLVGLVLVVLALVIGLPGIIWPGAVRWLFVGWMVLAFPIGWLVSQLMLLLMFFGLIAPVALLFRLRGRDPLRRRAAPDQPSFWLPKETPRDVHRYFCQY